MKIVKFEDFFHPEAGYHINILSKYLSNLGHDVVLFSSNLEKSPNGFRTFFDISNLKSKDKIFEINTGVKVVRFKTFFSYSGRAIVPISILKSMKNESPDIIYIRGNDTYVGIIATIFFKYLGCPIIFDSSMVDMASLNRFRNLFRFLYKTLITPIIIRERIKIIRNQNDKFVNIAYKVPDTLTPYLSFGVDTTVFNCNRINKNLRASLKITEEAFVVIYAGKMDLAKGLDIIMRSWEEVFETEREIVLLLVGNVSKNHLHQFENFIDKNKNKIIFIPTLKYYELAEYYCISDLAIFPRQFSLSFFNVQACGLPVLAEETLVNNDRLSYSNGFTYNPSINKDFLEKVLFISRIDKKKYQETRDNAVKFIKSGYDYEVIVNRYLDEFSNQINIFESS